MIDYKKIYNQPKTSSSEPNDLTSESAPGQEAVGLLKILESTFSIKDVTLNLTRVHIGLEEDNPFAGMSEDGDLGDDSSFDDGGSEDPFGTADGDGGDDPFGEAADNPFDSVGDDPFGGDDSGDGEEQKKPKELKISRQDILDQKFDMSRIIRKDFPEYILRLKDVCTSAIDILEKRQVHPELVESKSAIIERYRAALKTVSAYLDIIDSEAYEDIFTTYVNLWTSLNNLKKAANKLV